MPLTKVKSGGVSDSITLTSPDINAPDIDGGTIDNAVIGGSTAAAGSFTTITATGGSSSNWNTAYGWGDHSTQSYATQTYVGTAVSNLVDSSPAALDTLNELAAALGDDPNFATTVTNSIALKAPLASPSFTGNVGIGTSSPNSYTGQTTLNINSAGVARLDLDIGDTMQGFLLAESGYTGLFTPSGSNSLRFGTNNTERMRIDSSGNVGIGTNSPDAPLHIIGNDGVQFNRSGQTNGFIIRPNASADGIRFTQGGTGDRMTIDSSGNVGIGTTAPSTKLTVRNDSATTSFGDNNIITLQNANTTDNSRMGLAFTGNTGIGSGLAVIEAVSYDQSAGHTSLNFSVYNGSWHDDMMVLKAGNVGIGTAAAASLLHVNDPVSGNFGGEIRVGGTGSGRVLRLFQESATDYGLYATGASSILKFGTAGTAGVGTERARLDASGNLLVGYSAADGIGGSPSDNNFSELGKGYINLNRDDTATARQVQFGKNGVVAGYIETAGSSTSYVTSSDQRLKENIADADDAGSKIDAIQVRKFDWKVDGSHQDYGMIAQELQAVAPEAVSGDADSEEMMGVDYSKLVPMLIKEIQSLRNRVAQLEE